MANKTNEMAHTKWAGKERRQHNTSAPLKRNLHPVQAKENKIRKLTTGESLNYLLRQIHFTTTHEKAAQTLDLLNKLLPQIPGVVSGVRYLQRSHDAKL